MAAPIISKSPKILSAFKNSLKFTNDHKISKVTNYLLNSNDRFYSTEKDGKSEKKISTAMRIYLERAKEYDEFLKKEEHEFVRGTKHLARMMGYKKEDLTQEEIDQSIEYLFPSGLFEKRARPLMKPPSVIYPARKAAQFDFSGRPHHSMFYVIKQNYYQKLYDIVEKMQELNALEDKMISRGKKPEPQDKMDILGSTWKTQAEFETIFYEELKPEEYEYLINTLNRLVEHPYSRTIADFIMEHRTIQESLKQTMINLPIQYDENGRAFVHVNDCAKCTTKGEVKIWANGTGKITINGKDITFFGDMQSREQDKKGYAPIHYASDRDPSILRRLISSGCDVNLVTGKGGDSALHFAAAASCAENLALLLEKGAAPGCRNRRGQSPLHLAARAQSLECVETLLEAGCEANLQDKDGRTCLHLALGKSLLAFDVVSLLVVRGGARLDLPDKYGYTALHVAALNELSQCVDALIRHGADLSATTKGGTSALSVILRKTPSSLDAFERILDASLALHQHGSATSPATAAGGGEVELTIDFHPLLRQQHREKHGEIGYLASFVKEGYKEIVQHPLCQAFLYLKWQKIRKYYVGRLLFYLLYVLVLTAWVITALAHNCYNESHAQAEVRLCTNRSAAINGYIHGNPALLDLEWYTLLVLTLMETGRKLAGILTYTTARQFLTQPENMVEWCVVVSVFATSFVYTGRTYAWQSHIGAFAVLCGWSNLMLMVGQLPMFGAYVAMFTSVQAQVFKLLLAYACLLVGFTASFCVIFPQSKSFSSPHTGLIKVLVMMTGELDFEELFFPGMEEELEGQANQEAKSNGTSWILLQVSAQLSFVLFLLFVTIVLMNLLVGIAVHDIKGLQKTAGLAKLVRQTKLICDVERALFLGLLPKCLIKLLSWTALVLPSPLRAVVTVRPLNPRETRLPRDVLAAAYRIAKDQTRHRRALPFSKQASTTRHTTLLLESSASINNDLVFVRKICEENNIFIRKLMEKLDATVGST